MAGDGGTTPGGEAKGGKGSSDAWRRVEQLLQRVSELEADIAQTTEQKVLLEKQNEELAARVEVWVGAQTDGIVLERKSFLELERVREELQAACRAATASQTETEERLQQVREWNGVLAGEVDGLLARRHACSARREEAEHDVEKLQSVVAQLMQQLGNLDAERGALLEEQRRLEWGTTEAWKRVEAAEAREAEAFEAAHEAEEVRSEEAAAAEVAAALAAELAAAVEQEERAQSAAPLASVGTRAAGGRGDPPAAAPSPEALRLEVQQLQARIASESAAVREEALAASRNEEVRWREIDEAQQKSARLQDELCALTREAESNRAKCLQACEEQEAAQLEAAEIQRRAREAEGAAAADAARLGVERREWEARVATEAAETNAGREVTARDRALWEAERKELQQRLETERKNTEVQKKAIQATLGQLVLEKQELIQELARVKGSSLIK